jgi:hypothetical protein
MSSFFARHAVDRDASGFRLGEKGYPSAGRVAWDAWGGDAGRSWANAIVARAERQVKKQEGCPVATQDVAVNLKNRQVAIETANYGPLDPNEPNDLYWQERAEVFDTTPDQAKSSRCGNCAAFDVTAQIKECIAEGIGDEGDPYDVIDAGDLGYCRVFKFKCAAARTCDAWIAGGPIADKQMHPEGEVEGGDVKVEINVHQMPMKNDEDRPLMRYGSAPMLTLRKAEERKYTLGPLYMPNKVDAHGEFTDEDELQGAVWEYVRKGDRRIRLQHNRDVVAGEWVEVMTWPYEMTVETAMADGTVQKSEYPANTVFLGVVWKDWAWNLVKEGRVRGYSIGGKAERISVDMDKSVELLAKATKTEDGVEYPREAFAYAPDPERPSGWKLRLWDDLESKVTPRQLGRAVAALGPGGFRGNRVQIPADDLGDVKAKIRAAWRATYGEERAIPRAIA